MKLIDKISTNAISIQYLARFIELLIKYKEELNIDDFSFIVEVSDDHFFDESDIKAYGDLIDIFDIDNPYIIDYFRTKTESYLREELDDIKSDIDLSEYIKTYQAGPYGNVEHEQDEYGVKDELHDMSICLLNNFNSDSIHDLNIDISLMIDEVDVGQMFVNYFESQEPYREERVGGSWTSSDKDIDDLFERT